MANLYSGVNESSEEGSSAGADVDSTGTLRWVALPEPARDDSQVSTPTR
jgi:hypothetical protein